MVCQLADFLYTDGSVPLQYALGLEAQLISQKLLIKQKLVKQK